MKSPQIATIRDSLKIVLFFIFYGFVFLSSGMKETAFGKISSFFKKIFQTAVKVASVLI
jgi:hypothetical protein